jgi:hypothetical protein
MTSTATPSAVAEQTTARRLPQGRRRWVALAAAATVLVGGLVASTGLGGDDAATPPAQLTEVDLRAPSRLPVLKDAAKQPTEAGATAFALHWFDALNWSLSHNDDDLLAGITGAGCQQCTGYLIAVKRWKDSAARLEGGLSVPLDLAIGPFDIAQPVQFASSFLTTPATLVAKDGTATAYPGARTRGGLTVVWANGRWQMTDLVIDVRKAGATP